MSEAIRKYDDFDYLVRSLEQWHIDPMLERVFKSMREYNELLTDSPQNQAEITAIMQDIDNQWSGLLGAECRLSGYASFPDIWSIDAEEDARIDGARVYRPETTFHDDSLVYFNGAVPVPVGDTGESEDDKALYRLDLCFKKLDTDIEGDTVTLSGSCNLDQLVSLEFEEFMSVERSISIIETLQPALIEDIDDIMFNSGTDIERIIKMRGLSFDPESIGDAGETTLLQKALRVYTNNTLSIDAQVPHGLSIDGDLWLIQDNEPKIATTQSDFLSLIDSISWGTSPTKGNDHMVPLLTARLYQPYKSLDDMIVHIPIDSISRIESIRHQFYSGSAVNDSQEPDYIL